MDILIALVASVVFALALRTPLMRCPWAFYIGAVALDALFLSGALEAVVPDVNRELLPFLRRAIFPYALFVVVMYIGVLPESSRLRAYLKPVRGPLSIVAALLALCHIASYLSVYMGPALKGFGTMADSTLAALAMAVALAVLLTALTVTSFAAVRRRMHARTWLLLQKAAYVFFALFTLHAVVLLLPSSMAGGSPALAVSLYSGVFLLYVILRVGRRAFDRCSEKVSTSAPRDLAELEPDFAL